MQIFVFDFKFTEVAWGSVHNKPVLIQLMTYENWCQATAWDFSDPVHRHAYKSLGNRIFQWTFVQRYELDQFMVE